MARPERLELPTLWFEDMQYKTLSAAAGVAYRGNAPFISLLSWTEDGLKNDVHAVEVVTANA